MLRTGSPISFAYIHQRRPTTVFIVLFVLNFLQAENLRTRLQHPLHNEMRSILSRTSIRGNNHNDIFWSWNLIAILYCVHTINNSHWWTSWLLRKFDSQRKTHHSKNCNANNVRQGWQNNISKVRLFTLHTHANRKVTYLLQEKIVTFMV